MNHLSSSFVENSNLSNPHTKQAANAPDQILKIQDQNSDFHKCFTNYGVKKTGDFFWKTRNKIEKRCYHYHNDTSKWKSTNDEDTLWCDSNPNSNPHGSASIRGLKFDMSDYYHWEAQKLKYKKIRERGKNRTFGFGGSEELGGDAEDRGFGEWVMGGRQGRVTEEPFGATGGLGS